MSTSLSSGKRIVPGFCKALATPWSKRGLLQHLDRRIRRVLDSVRTIREARSKYAANQIALDELVATVQASPNSETFFAENAQLEIRRIDKHYYIPVLLSNNERIAYIRSIIHVKSEVRFLRQLEDYLGQPDNKFKKFDWWLFSRVDEKTDDINIPYYYPIENRIANFKPDFIFWLKKGSRYHILFMDPKGTGRTEYEHKVDGYKNLFEEKGQPKLFQYQDMQVSVHVFLHTSDRQVLAEGYRNYWFDRIEQVLNTIS